MKIAGIVVVGGLGLSAIACSGNNENAAAESAAGRAGDGDGPSNGGTAGQPSDDGCPDPSNIQNILPLEISGEVSLYDGSNALAVDERYVYFPHNGDDDIARVDKAGGALAILAERSDLETFTNGVTDFTSFVLDDEYLYFGYGAAYDDALWSAFRIPKSGGAPEKLWTEFHNILNMAVDESSLYVLDRTGSSRRVLRMAKAGQAEPEVVADTSEGFQFFGPLLATKDYFLVAGNDSETVTTGFLRWRKNDGFSGPEPMWDSYSGNTPSEAFIHDGFIYFDSLFAFHRVPLTDTSAEPPTELFTTTGSGGLAHVGNAAYHPSSRCGAWLKGDLDGGSQSWVGTVKSVDLGPVSDGTSIYWSDDGKLWSMTP
jgi:hypothetical protein